MRRSSLLDIETFDTPAAANRQGVANDTPRGSALQPANDNRPIPRQIDKLFTSALAIEFEAAKEAGALGFMARAMVQATMPHKRVSGNEFTRINGAFAMTMLAPSKIGLPYGSIPRLVTGFLTTEAVRSGLRTGILSSVTASAASWPNSTWRQPAAAGEPSRAYGSR